MISTDERSQIKAWLDQYEVKDYMISDEGVIDVNNRELTTLKDCPSTKLPYKFGKVAGALKITGKITSLENLPHTISGTLSLYETEVTDLTGISKIIKKIDGTLILPKNIINVLGLIMIEGVIKVDSDRDKIDAILNKHLAERDIIAAQDEFLEAGMKAQARS